jgi:tRNA pseudouridine38-40 synthase
VEALRLWAVVEYDGTEFAGFQVQARERTVQGEIERALEAVTGHSARIVGAGRTDSGVHASGQVIAFSVPWCHEIRVLRRALNALLAADVAIVEIGPASGGFHPRYSATSRTYHYTILNQEWRSPLWRRTAWHVKEPLDVPQMAAASRYLVGTHDFTTFGRPPDGRENGVRTVLGAEWVARDNVLTFEIEANAFLYRMVRSIVGTLVLVGAGRLPAEEVAEMLLARDRSLVRQVAPAMGLCLTKVSYPVSEGVMQ